MIRMLKFYPDQVAKHWSFIRPAIESALPPIGVQQDADARMSKVLESILSGRLVVHIFFKLIDERPTISGVLTTGIMSTIDGSGDELLIYSIFGSDKISRHDIMEAFDLIKKYAKSVGCSVIIAYTNKDSLKSFVKFKGGEASYTVLRMEV